MSIRHVFAQNLKTLIDDFGTVTEVSRKLEINRTQLIRYTTGESFPGPDILVRLCDFFEVPLTIIKTPLAEIAHQEVSQGLPSDFNNCFEPAPKSAFPNGFYREYTYKSSEPCPFQHCIGHATSDKGRRIFSIYAPDRNRIGEGLEKRRRLKRKFKGYVFSQPTGFCMLDNIPGNPVFALTAFRTGFFQSPHIFPGFKLSSKADIAFDIHSGRPTVLEYIGTDYRAALRHGRGPQYIKKDDLSDLVQLSFEQIFAQNAPHKS